MTFLKLKFCLAKEIYFLTSFITGFSRLRELSYRNSPCNKVKVTKRPQEEAFSIYSNYDFDAK
ncbi:hypothetical protein C0Z22_09210 [Halobacteriovorax sp. DA5]|nr:hypothetical protein C0Z22_09210 [Halobacteriovorax sp. DA5]